MLNQDGTEQGMQKGMKFVHLAARLKDAILTARPPSHECRNLPCWVHRLTVDLWG
jgi:hypothetical protein